MTASSERPADPGAPGPGASLVIVIMGVAGSGKTTIGQKLAGALHWAFRDADEFHPPANIVKMSAGVPLTDADRAPWLAAVRAYIDERLRTGTCAVVTCSALREQYRATLLADPPRVKLVHLAADYELIRHRLERRQNHFMTAGMLESQFATLEPPRNALKIDAAQSPDAIVAAIRQTLCV